MSQSKLADKLIGHTVSAYMDAVDFLYEEGRPIDGNKFFADIENLRAEKKCTKDCGIVRVEVKLVEWVQLPDATGPMKFKDQA